MPVQYDQLYSSLDVSSLYLLALQTPILDGLILFPLFSFFPQFILSTPATVKLEPGQTSQTPDSLTFLRGHSYSSQSSRDSCFSSGQPRLTNHTPIQIHSAEIGEWKVRLEPAGSIQRAASPLPRWSPQSVAPSLSPQPCAARSCDWHVNYSVWWW